MFTQKANKNKVVTGYILYSREVRKSVVQNNPDSNFGEISKIVGNEWRSLSAGEKQAWEEKASKLNEETKALLLEEQCASPATANPDTVMTTDRKKKLPLKYLIKIVFRFTNVSGTTAIISSRRYRIVSNTA